MSLQFFILMCHIIRMTFGLEMLHMRITRLRDGMFGVDYSTTNEFADGYQSIRVSVETISDSFGKSAVGQLAWKDLKKLKTDQFNQLAHVAIVDKSPKWEKFWTFWEWKGIGQVYYSYKSEDDIRVFINKEFSKHIADGIRCMRILPINGRIWIDYSTGLPGTGGYLTDWIPLTAAIESLEGSPEGSKSIKLIKYFAKLNGNNNKSVTKRDLVAIPVDLQQKSNTWKNFSGFDSNRNAYLSHYLVDPEVAILINKTFCRI
ncbi:hypothetical protein PtA15_13A157 [Puccinia triticina]|uniref:Uncharacterized protein n=1 Tax=Puccinia triticina TaxID=208348 RepID=A0ABY7CZL2_9BASI|nr:uncharacterized protein PtA15_13A157 [Puccinia triticina]WAQ90758.1 hypothetical protein PtA15_13A157 [Puccinia triticina]